MLRNDFVFLTYTASKPSEFWPNLNYRSNIGFRAVRNVRTFCVLRVGNRKRIKTGVPAEVDRVFYLVEYRWDPYGFFFLLANRRAQNENRQRPVGRHVQVGLGQGVREIRSDKVRWQLGRRVHQFGVPRDHGQQPRTVFSVLLKRYTRTGRFPCQTLRHFHRKHLRVFQKHRR